ncbi:MAG: mandelate racemase/muconate lactonizing enzyme family protein [Pikeienuella sp.]
MKIASIEIYQADLPYAGGTYRLSGGRVYESFDCTFVRVIADNGLDGWGESTPFGGTYIAAHGRGVRAGLAEVAPEVLGMDPRQTARAYDAMDAVLVGHNHAKSPIDNACWDLFGKSVNMPVCDLLGGRISGPIPVISSIGSDTPEAMRANVAAHRARGFKGHSVKIGATEAEGGPALDAERIAACLADRQPGEWFQADANGGLTPEHALRTIAKLPAGTDIVLEAPCATWRETLSLRARCPYPIMLDELVQSDADLAQLIATDAADGVGLKISKQGGLTPTRRQRDIANAAGLVASVQETTGSTIAFAAILHMAQSTPRRMLRCALDTRSMIDAPTATFKAPIIDGGVTVPDAPGLGITPNMDLLGDPIAVYE